MKEKAVRRAMILLFVLFMVFFHPAPAVFDSQPAITASAAVKMKLNETNITLHISDEGKETYQLKVIGTNKKVKWSSSDPKIVSVTKKGKVTAKKAGKAAVTAKVSGISLKCRVTVKKTAIQEDSGDDKGAGDNKNTGDDKDAGDNKNTGADKNHDADSGDEGAGGDSNADSGLTDGGKADTDTGDNSKTDNSGTDNKTNPKPDTAYDLLYRVIMEKGDLNSDNNYEIRERTAEGDEYSILYDVKAEQFQFIGVLPEVGFVAHMDLDRKGSKSTYMQCTFAPYNKIGIFRTKASFNLEDYVYKNTLDFKVIVKSKYGFGDSQCVTLSRSVCDLCMLRWEVCIRKNSNFQLTMKDLGFVNFNIYP